MDNNEDKKMGNARAGKDGEMSVSAREEAIQKFWKDNSIFEKTLDANKDKEPYVFYDGPPFATGLPHYGHLLAGTIKDVVPRFQTMRGRYVRREWGWDCHGLPIENLIEKELGFKTKKDIEEYGIENFNQKARESVLTYDKEWRSIVERMGRFVDMDKGYKTMDATYTDSIWWAFKTLHDKKLIYEGFKSMHVCPRCETTLAISEVGMNYKDVKDISVYVKFELVDEPNTFLVAWTTTPWTLPGNVALAIGADIEYVKVSATPSVAVNNKRSDGSYHEPERWEEFYIFAKARLEPMQMLAQKEGKDMEVVGTFKGSDLVGKSYKPLFDYYAADEKLENRENGWKIYAADFVTAEDGTGIAHEAPAFGEVDMELGKKMKLPFIQHVSMNGEIKPEVKEFAGLSVKPKSDDDKVRLGTDIAVLKYLQEHGLFFAKENINHSYPHCWRCDTPLLNYAASSWFVDVIKLKPRLLEENKEISWIPEHMGEGRFGKWLEGARDWAISRTRYWGAPIPVWKCNKCAKTEVIGSSEELKSKLTSGNTYFVMRHGESESNVKGIVSYKPEDPFPLTGKGEGEVKATAKKLEALLKSQEKSIDFIIASPVLRTKQTALLVSEALGLSREQVIFDERIAEVNTGEFNGCSIEDYRSQFSDTLEKFYKRPPNGETLEEMKSRIAAFLYDVDAKYKGKTILFVTHEYCVWMMQAAARGATNEEASRMREVSEEDFILTGESREFHFAPLSHNRRYELDFHRPFVDVQTTYQCSCGLGTMTRVSDVFDCWFESGAMPFAQFHYMGDERTEDGKHFIKNFPADFIAEGIDQTRGWFYTLLILSTGLFDRSPYKSVIVNGLILAEDGQKMSKKLKNYPDPMEVVAKYGADALRYYLLSSPAVRGEELRFVTAGVDEVFKKITLRIGNVRSFYEMYQGQEPISRESPKSTNVLDQWILARFLEAHAEITHFLDNHELDRAARPVLPFVDDLSTWYLRRSRDRFKNQSNNSSSVSLRNPADSSPYENMPPSSASPRLTSEVSLIDSPALEATRTTGWILFQFAKLIAPFMPFLAEDIYQRLSIENKKESVHLESWNNVGIAASTILADMEEVRRLVTLALDARVKAGIKVRQPLALLSVNARTLKNKDALLAIIADEVNVKKILLTDQIDSSAVILDTVITPLLKDEGILRDLIRLIQENRKRLELVPDNAICLTYQGDPAIEALVEKYKKELESAANITLFEKKLQEGGTLALKDASSSGLTIAIRKV